MAQLTFGDRGENDGRDADRRHSDEGTLCGLRRGLRADRPAVRPGHPRQALAASIRREVPGGRRGFRALLSGQRSEPTERISVRDLPGARGVTLLHRGPYDSLAASCARVLEYVRNRDCEAILPTREAYHRGPGMIFKGNSRNYRTEIQVPMDAICSPRCLRRMG